MNPTKIDSYSEIGSLSSYSYTVNIVFFEEKNIVAKVTKYENCKPIINLTGGNPEDRLKVSEFLSNKKD